MEDSDTVVILVVVVGTWLVEVLDVPLGVGTSDVDSDVLASSLVIDFIVVEVAVVDDGSDEDTWIVSVVDDDISLDDGDGSSVVVVSLVLSVVDDDCSLTTESFEVVVVIGSSVVVSDATVDVGSASVGAANTGSGARVCATLWLHAAPLMAPTTIGVHPCGCSSNAAKRLPWQR